MTKSCKISLFFASLIISLILSELVVRLLSPQPLVRVYSAPDASLGTILRPNQEFFDQLGKPMYSYHVKTNSHGMRMDEDVAKSTQKKIIMLGDSFTFGWGVEIRNSYFYLLKSKVEEFFPQVQFLNAGQGAYSTGHVLKLLSRYNQNIDLSGAIYFMNSNDLLDNVNTNIDYQVVSFLELEDGSIVLRDVEVYSNLKRFLLIYTPYGWLNQHSHIFILTKKVIKSILNNKSTAQEPTVQINVSNLSNDEKSIIYRVSLANLRRLASFCYQQGIPLLIIWIPDQSEIFVNNPADPNIFYSSFKNLILSDYDILKKEVVFFDPTSRMVSLIRGDSMPNIYFPDGHYNEEGNRLFSKSVFNAILRFTERVVDGA